MLTTAMTDVTPITTPRSVSTLRSLWAQRLVVAMRTASPSVMEVLLAIKQSTSSGRAVAAAKAIREGPKTSVRIRPCAPGDLGVQDADATKVADSADAVYALILTYVRGRASITGSKIR